ncbi:MAG: hypothetical protein WEE64_03015 [Dehalococcoidia bacterium]
MNDLTGAYQVVPSLACLSEPADKIGTGACPIIAEVTYADVAAAAGGGQ